MRTELAAPGRAGSFIEFAALPEAAQKGQVRIGCPLGPLAGKVAKRIHRVACEAR